jgi:DUF4097 and DUF4098 domain-containing protein YvlB
MKKLAIFVGVGLLAMSAAAAEKREEITKSFPYQEGKLVFVDAGPLDLSVRVSEINEIRVRVELVAGAFMASQATAWIEASRPTIEDKDGELRIVAPSPGGVKIFKGVLITRAHIELVVPPRVLPDLSTSSGTLRAEGEFLGGKPMRLRAATGAIELTGWAPEIEGRSTSGDLTLRASRAIDKLMLRTASGSVLLIGGARSVRCDTSNGKIRLEGLIGPAGIATTSGSVTARFDSIAATDEIRISTTSGRVDVTLPPTSAPGGEIVSSKGDIRSKYAGHADPQGGKLQLAGAGVKVFVTTSSGRIELL